MQIGQRAGADALVRVVSGLKLYLLSRIGPNLRHMVHVATPVLHVLLGTSDCELLRIEDCLLRLRNR